MERAAHRVRGSSDPLPPEAREPGPSGPRKSGRRRRGRFPPGDWFRARARGCTLVAVLFCAAALTAQPAPEAPPNLLDAFAFRHIGPIGNRVSAVAGVPGDPRTYYAGAASGGLWRSTDGGVGWDPMFDRQEAASIGSLAVAPSDPNVIWVGTGESFIRSNISIGNGVYRSTDRGDSFEHLGLDRTGRIGRILIHPEDPDTAFVAALGHAYGPQELDEAGRGVFRTSDGGATWEHVLFVDADTGVVDLAFAPDNPRFVYAAAWQIEIRTSGRTSGGPGSGLYRSGDGGDTWLRLEGAGLPDPPLGKIGLAVSADDPDRVYALIETSSNRDFAPVRPLRRRPLALGRPRRLVAVDQPRSQPDHPAALLHAHGRGARPRGRDQLRRDPAIGLARRRPHGRERGLRAAGLGPPRHLDRSARRRTGRIVGHDGGVSITTDRERSWYRPQLPIAQMYHVSTDDRRAVLRLQQPPGRTLHARAEPRPLRRTHPGHPGRRVALRRRLRGRLFDGPPRRPGPGLDRLLRRPARALRPAFRPVARRQRLAAGDREFAGLGHSSTDSSGRPPSPPHRTIRRPSTPAASTSTGAATAARAGSGSRPI